jgi:CRP/FNR family cyclic AMP-dependent transcriptional regulator
MPIFHDRTPGCQLPAKIDSEYNNSVRRSLHFAESTIRRCELAAVTRCTRHGFIHNAAQSNPQALRIQVMSDEIIGLLQRIDMFNGLTEPQLRKLSGIFSTQALDEKERLFEKGDQANHLYLVKEGFVEVVVNAQPPAGERTIVNLGPGQSVGEMSLVDRGSRSASVYAAAGGATVVSAPFADFDSLCEEDPLIGYRVMRNIAADLSFRLRHQHLQNY